MIVRTDAVEAKRLIEDGIRTIDVLPTSVFDREHLPGARTLPLETFQPSQVATLDRSEPILVYCFDQHCDLSARASARLDHLGFEKVHDLVGGRAAWTALGFPTDGSVGDRRRISAHVLAVPSIGIDGSVRDLNDVPGEVSYPTPIVNEAGVLLGAVARTAAELPAETPLADIMTPAPGTIRPELRIDEVAEQLARDGLDHVWVTSVDGRLIGLVVAEELHV